MKRIAYLIAFLGLVLFSVPAHADDDHGKKKPQNVNVVNEPTVHVGTMPDVNFVGDVNVTNTPLDVNVTNEPLKVVVTDPCCCHSDCGTFKPVIWGDFSPGSPVVGGAVVLSLGVTDSDNDPTCGLSQHFTINSEFVQMPPFSTTALTPTVGYTPAFYPDVAGEYVVRSTVTDEVGCSSSTDTVITVIVAPAQ